MAAETVSAAEFQELAARYEALERQANSLLAAMRRGRAIRNLLLLGLIVIVGVLVYTLVQIGNRLTSEKFLKELADGAQIRAEKNWPALQKQMMGLYEKSSPVLTKAFQTQAEKDQPKYVQTAEKEWPEFKKGFEAKVEEKFREQYKGLLTKMKPRLEEIAPELKTDPGKYQKLEEGLVAAAYRTVDKHFNQKILPLFEKLEVSWASYPAAPKPGAEDPTIGMQIVGHMYELLALAVAKGDGLAAVIDQPERKPIRATNPTKKAPEAPNKTGGDAKKGG